MAWQTGKEEQKAPQLKPETAELLRRYNDNPDTLILAWRDSQAQLENAKSVEMALRRAVFEIKFPDPKEGTQRFELGNGWKLKAQFPYNYKLDPEKAEDTLDKIAKLSPTAAVIADRLCKWKPEVSIKEYRLLCEDKSPEGEKARKLLDAILTITPGSPQLEIEPPKAKA